MTSKAYWEAIRHDHSCGNYHYGDQTVVRPCCVEHAKEWKATTLRVAMTTQHAAYLIFQTAWNSLTDAERALVGDLVAVYDHGPAGFDTRPFQADAHADKSP